MTEDTSACPAAMDAMGPCPMCLAAALRVRVDPDRLTSFAAWEEREDRIPY